MTINEHSASDSVCIIRPIFIACAAITAILAGGCHAGNQEDAENRHREAVALRGPGQLHQPQTSGVASTFVVESNDTLSFVDKWDFSVGSLQDWEVVNSPIPSVTWHIVDHRSNATGTHSLYFGNPSTRNYDEGHVSATLRSPPVHIPHGGPSFFDVEAYVDCEPYPQWVNYDTLDLYVVANTEVRKWRQRAELGLGNTEGKFVRFRSEDLSDFAGHEIRFELRFDSVDHLFNDHAGIYITWVGLTFDDGDAIGREDNCPLVNNPDQIDSLGDGVGDACRESNCLPSQAKQWRQTIADWPVRNDHTSVVFQDKIWVLGGWAETKNVNDIWTSEDGNTWSEIAPTSPWPQRSGHTSVVFQNKLWVIGGSGASSYLNDVWSSPDGINWTEETPNAPWAARFAHSTVVFQDKIWVFGGAAIIGRLEFPTDVWSSPDGVNWTEETPNAPFLGRARHTAPFGNCLRNAKGSSRAKSPVWLASKLT